MVTNKLSGDDVVRRAGELDLPRSVVEFLQGQLGIPVGGFPEPLRFAAGAKEIFLGRHIQCVSSLDSSNCFIFWLDRSEVLRRAKLDPINTRPGTELPPLDFKLLKKQLVDKYESAQKHGIHISDTVSFHLLHLSMK